MKSIQRFCELAHAKLSTDFPSLSEKDRTKIINRYITTVTNEINDKLRSFNQPGSNCFFVSLRNIQIKSKSTINGKQQYMNKWFEQNCPLYLILNKGNNLIKQYTVVKMNYNLKIDIDMAYAQAISENGIPESEMLEILQKMYSPELFVIIEQANDDLVDFVPIAMNNLKAYISKTEHIIKQSPNNKLELNLREAKRIYVIAHCCNGELIQIKNESDFGRLYYKGPNLQSCSKEVRHAALGPCYEYDIENSVYAWRYNEVTRILNEFNMDIKFTYTLDYIDRKEYWRKELARYVFKNTKLSEDYKIKLIKQVFTAIGFGAKGSKAAIFWGQGNNKQTLAINSIIKNKEDRERLLSHEFIIGFINEQNDITNIIFEYYKSKINIDCIKQGGRIAKSKLISYLYQKQERVLLEVASECFDNVLLKVHDAFYTKTKNIDALANAIYKLKQYNSELTLNRTDIKPWTTFDKAVEYHKQFIINEEIKVKHYNNQYVIDVSRNPNYIDIIIQDSMPYIENHHVGYNRDEDPFYN